MSDYYQNETRSWSQGAHCRRLASDLDASIGGDPGAGTGDRRLQIGLEIHTKRCSTSQYKLGIACL